MKKFFSFLILWLFSVTSAHAEGVLALGAVHTESFLQIVEGFILTCNCEVETSQAKDQKDQGLFEQIQQTSPVALLAVGMNGVFAALEVATDLPIIYSQVFNPQPFMRNRDSTGVVLEFPPKAQLEALLAALPNIKRLGFVYDPAYSTSRAEQMREAARSLGITLVEGRTDNPRKVPKLINEMKDKIDVFWLTPDQTVVTFETLEYLARFSMENQIPTLAFAEKYMDMGIALGLNADNVDLGKQTGAIAKKIIHGAKARDIPPEEARKAILVVNRRIAAKLGLPLNNGKVVFWGEEKP